MYETQQAAEEASLATGKSSASEQPQASATSAEPKPAPETARDIGQSDGEDTQVHYTCLLLRFKLKLRDAQLRKSYYYAIFAFGVAAPPSLHVSTAECSRRGLTGGLHVGGFWYQRRGL